MASSAAAPGRHGGRRSGGGRRGERRRRGGRGHRGQISRTGNPVEGSGRDSARRRNRSRRRRQGRSDPCRHERFGAGEAFALRRWRPNSVGEDGSSGAGAFSGASAEQSVRPIRIAGIDRARQSGAPAPWRARGQRSRTSSRPTSRRRRAGRTPVYEPFRRRASARTRPRQADTAVRGPWTGRGGEPQAEEVTWVECALASLIRRLQARRLLRTASADAPEPPRPSGRAGRPRGP